MDLFLGKKVRKETNSIEYKMFTIHDCDDYFEEDEIKTICYGNITKFILFNTMILNNLEYYCFKYIPKYLSIFGNSNLPFGKLLFGIDDFGEITGIPYLGSIESLHNVIDNCLRNIGVYIKSENKDVLIEQIKYNIKKLDTSNYYEDVSISEKIDAWEKKVKTINDNWNIYLNEKTKWLNKITKANTNLNNYANDPSLRSIVLDYVKQNSPDSISIVNLLSSDEIIEIDYVNIEHNIKDRTKLEHWIGRAKDNYIELIEKQRPPKQSYPYLTNIYKKELNLLTNLRKNLLDHNEISYYIIEIIFPTKSKNKVLYRLKNSPCWYYKERCMIDDSPGCISKRY